MKDLLLFWGEGWVGEGTILLLFVFCLVYFYLRGIRSYFWWWSHWSTREVQWEIFQLLKRQDVLNLEQNLFSKLCFRHVSKEGVNKSKQLPNCVKHSDWNHSPFQLIRFTWISLFYLLSSYLYSLLDKTWISNIKTSRKTRPVCESKFWREQQREMQQDQLRLSLNIWPQSHQLQKKTV